MTCTVVVLAAGKGTRTQFPAPKIMLPIGGKPIIYHIIDNAKAAAEFPILVVTRKELVTDIQQTHPDITIIPQEISNGTGGALQMAMPHIKTEYVLIILGDTPLISPELLKHMSQTSATIKIGTLSLSHPEGYGRIIRQNNKVQKIIEEKEASAQEKLITEVNSGLWCLKVDFLKHHLEQLEANHAQGELYLTDLVEKAHGHIETTPVPEHEVMGANTLSELAKLEALYQEKYTHLLMSQGVLMTNPKTVTLRGIVKIGPGTIIEPNVIIENTEIGQNCLIGPNVCIKSSKISDSVNILTSSIIEEAIIHSNCQVGPMAHIRTQTILHKGAVIGNFVETKSSDIGANSKAKHLSYIGNAIIGKSVNIGAGTITCNYDGKHKHLTQIQDNAFIGSNTALIAPISIGENCLIAAGSTITKSVDANHLVFARAKQISKQKETV